jgi:hypothetical protein
MMVLVPSECMSEVQELIEQHEIHAYTEIPSVLGSGRAGRKLGTRAFPGTSGMLLAITETPESVRVVEAIREYAGRSSCAKAIRIFAVPAESVL